METFTNLKQIKCNNYTEYIDTQYESIILDIYNGNGKNIVHNDSTIYNVLGNYHHEVTKNYPEMEKYYLMAIDLGNSNAMSNYADYHHMVTKNYLEMEKYYLMAINLGNDLAMHNYAHYHQYITKNYIEMEKYYLMAIDLGDSDAMTSYADYHYNIKNYTEM